MTEQFDKHKTYQVDHTTFGGIIYTSDFDRKTTLSDIASRIENDRKFDEQCKRNALSRQNYGGNKNA